MDTSYIEQVTGYPESVVSPVISAFFNYIQVELRKGEEVKISDFGVFYTKELGERQSRNPRTGEKITAPPRIKPRFRFYDSFENLIQTSPFAQRPGGNQDTEKAKDKTPPSPPSSAPSSASESASESVEKTKGKGKGKAKAKGSVPPVPPPVPAAVSKTWHIAKPDGTTSTYPTSELKGVLQPGMLVWSEGQEGWKTAQDVPELSAFIA